MLGFLFLALPVSGACFLSNTFRETAGSNIIHDFGRQAVTLIDGRIKAFALPGVPYDHTRDSIPDEGFHVFRDRLLRRRIGKKERFVVRVNENESPVFTSFGVHVWPENFEVRDIEGNVSNQINYTVSSSGCTILYGHGNGETVARVLRDRHDWRYLQDASKTHAFPDGCSVFLYEYPNYADNEGPPPDDFTDLEVSLRATGVAAFNWVVEAKPENEQIFVAGFSIGTVPALEQVRIFKRRIRGAMLMATMESVASSAWVGRLLPGLGGFDNVATAKEITVRKEFEPNVLLLHSSEDRVCGFEGAERVREALGENAVLIESASEGHNAVMSTGKDLEKAKQWFACLSPSITASFQRRKL